MTKNTHTHTHTHMYVCVCVCVSLSVCVCVCWLNMTANKEHNKRVKYDVLVLMYFIIQYFKSHTSHLWLQIVVTAAFQELSSCLADWLQLLSVDVLDLWIMKRKTYNTYLFKHEIIFKKAANF